LNDVSFSRILKDERIRRALTLEQASAATRVRLQILRAFEEGDFAAMPPRGYSKNMIASYARWLGLDPQGVVETYLDDLAVYEADRRFEDDPYSHYGSRDAGDAGRGEPTRRGRPKRYQRSAQTNLPRHYEGGRSMDDTYSHAAAHNQTSRSFKGTSYGRSPGHNGRSPRSSRIFSDSRGYQRGGGNNRVRIIVVAVIAVALVILAVILSSYISSCSKKDTSVNTPVASTTKVDGSSADTQTGTNSTSTALTSPFNVTFTVADGQTCAIVATVDGLDAYNGTAVGPVSQSYSVSTAITMTFSNPGVVTVTRDDQPVQIVVGSDGTGTLSLSSTTPATTTGETATQTTATAS